MQIAVQKIGDSSVLVTPDGQPIPYVDCDDWTLHLMPQILIKRRVSSVSLIRANLKLRTDGAGLLGLPQITFHNVLPIDVQVTQPCPNESFYVAGSRDRKMGWEFPLRENQTWAELSLTWQVHQNQVWIIHHRIQFNLEHTQQGHLFSMASANTMFGINSRNAKAIAHFDESSVGHTFAKSDDSFHYRFDRSHFRIDFEQTLDLQSHAWSDVPHLELFEDQTQLHNIEPAKTFLTYSKEHLSCACLEIPPDVLLESVEDALQETHSLSEGQYHASKGVRTICEWWNQNAPVEAYRHAGGVEIWCRVEDGPEYWSAQYERPETDIKCLLKLDPNTCARFGDHFLIYFLEKPEENRIDDNDTRYINYVDGTSCTNIWDEVEYSYFSWQSLAVLPTMFPVAYEQVLAKGYSLTSPERVVAQYQRGERYFPILTLRGANFSGMDLRGIDFWESDLRGADFSAANLEGACLVGCDLRGVDFSNANLSRTDLRNVWIKATNLYGANLDGAEPWPPGT